MALITLSLMRFSEEELGKLCCLTADSDAQAESWSCVSASLAKTEHLTIRQALDRTQGKLSSAWSHVVAFLHSELELCDTWGQT